MHAMKKSWIVSGQIHVNLTLSIIPTIIILSCSGNIVAEGMGGQASGTIAHRRQASLPVLYIHHSHV